MRIVVSGGGSAGHITPILATVDALKSLEANIEILYIGQSGSMEDRIARGAGYNFAAISAGKLRRYSSQGLLDKLRDVSTLTLNARDMGRAVKGFTQARKILQQFDPHVVFVKGGFVGLPVGLAARSLGIPYVIHESDMRPGLTNRILSKHANKVAVGFPVNIYKDWQPNKLVYTGNPVRKELLKAHHLEGLAKFKLSDDKPVILVVCGSQGAQAINETLIECLPELTKRYQLIHVTGEKNIEAVRFAVGRLTLEQPNNYQAHSFLGESMGQALAAADIVVGRGGANTFSELAALGKPAIIVPHPDLSDQVLNATTLSRAGAIKVLPQGRLSKHSLTSQLDQVLGSESEMESLSKAISAFAVKDADQQLAQLILSQAVSQTKTEHREVIEGESPEEEGEG